MDETYRLSPRVTITRGDKIKISGGPRYRSDSGRMIRLRYVPTGECEFHGVDKDRAGNTLLYVKQHGAFAVAAIDRVTATVDDHITNQPYRITKKRKC